jgi:hypothetical protein
MRGAGRESECCEKSLRHRDSALADRPLTPKRGERERAAASGKDRILHKLYEPEDDDSADAGSAA